MLLTVAAPALLEGNTRHRTKQVLRTLGVIVSYASNKRQIYSIKPIQLVSEIRYIITIRQIGILAF